MWFDRLKFSHYERITGNCRCLPREIRSVLAGSSRVVRLEIDDEVDSPQYVVQSVAAGVVCPLTFLYVWWVLKDATKRGCQRLYFLARDGHVLYKVAKILVDRWSLDIDLRYLYCSRESLLLPSFREVSDFEKYWISWGYLSSITFDEILLRLNLKKTDLADDLADEEFFSKSTKPLDKNALERVWTVISLPSVISLITENNRYLIDTTLGYLRQEGLFEKVPYGLVDTGWKGTSQYALSSLLNHTDADYGADLPGYYLGLNDHVFKFKDNQLRSFLFDWTRSRRDYRLYNFLCFEMLFATTHERTKSYTCVDGLFKPEFVENSPEGDHILIETHHKAAKQYVDYVTRVLSFSDFPENTACLCRKLMRKFISAPEPDEAKVYGDYLIASEIREGDFQMMAPEMSFSDFAKVVCGREKIKGFWPQASFVRSGLKAVNFGYNIFLDLKLLELYRKYVLRY